MGVKKVVERAVKAAVTKFSPAEVKRITAAVRESAAEHRRSGKFDNFQEIEDEDILRKLNRVNSPFINSQGWGSPTPGGTLSYSVGIFNPDPGTANSLYVHVFFGSGNPVTDAGAFLLNVDERLPRVTEPAAFGFSLASAGSTSIAVSVKIPAALEKGKYIGNTALLQLSPFNDVGKLLDRSVFVVNVI